MKRHAPHKPVMSAACLAAATALAFLLVTPASAQQRIGEPVPGLRGLPSEVALPENGATAALDDLDPAGRPLSQTTPRRPATSPSADENPTTGTVRVGSVDGLDEERNARTARDNERTGAIEGLPIPPEDAPFAPLGIRAGSFIVTPTLEQGIGWASNATGASGGRPAWFSESALRLNIISDWSRHAATIRADGLYRKSLSGAPIEDIEGGIRGELRLDLMDDFTATASAGYRMRPEDASTPGTIANAAERPLRQTLEAGLGLARSAGKARLSIDGNLTRDIYQNARLTNGTIVSQRDRDATLATARVRSGYEISPALTPFVEAEIGRRFYDRVQDANGLRRSANRYALRGGVELDLGEKLRGEFSAGWLTERPDDAALRPVEGLSVGANLAWSPVRGTTVDLTASTEVETSTAAGDTGSLLYSGSLAVNRELRSNLTGRALVGLDWRDYAGSDHDLILRGEASLTWWMNRNLGLTGRLRHEKQTSTLPGRSYDASSVYLGMTMQR